MNEMGSGPTETAVPEAAPEAMPEASPEVSEAGTESLAEQYGGESRVDEIPQVPQVEVGSPEVYEQADEAYFEEMPEPPPVEADSEAALESAEAFDTVEELPEPPPVEAHPEAFAESEEVVDSAEEMPEPPPVEADSEAILESAEVGDSAEELPEPPPVEAHSEAFAEAEEAADSAEVMPETPPVEAGSEATLEPAEAGDTVEELPEASKASDQQETESQSERSGEYRQITHSEPVVSEDGKWETRTSEVTYSPEDDFENPRNSPAGRSADRQARGSMFAETGWGAGHGHSLNQGNEPSDLENIDPQNAIQNEGGGTWYQAERARDRELAAHPETEVTERIEKHFNEDREGYGPDVPVYRKMIHEYPDGSTTGEDVLYLNSTSSASRRADELRSQELSMEPGEARDLLAQDRENIVNSRREADPAEVARQQAEWNQLKKDNLREDEMNAGEREALEERRKRMIVTD